MADLNDILKGPARGIHSWLYWATALGLTPALRRWFLGLTLAGAALGILALVAVNPGMPGNWGWNTIEHIADPVPGHDYQAWGLNAMACSGDWLGIATPRDGLVVVSTRTQVPVRRGNGSALDVAAASGEGEFFTLDDRQGIAVVARQRVWREDPWLLAPHTPAWPADRSIQLQDVVFAEWGDRGLTLGVGGLGLARNRFSRELGEMVRTRDWQVSPLSTNLDLTEVMPTRAGYWLRLGDGSLRFADALSLDERPERAWLARDHGKPHHFSYGQTGTWASAIDDRDRLWLFRDGLGWQGPWFELTDEGPRGAADVRAARIQNDTLWLVAKDGLYAYDLNWHNFKRTLGDAGITTIEPVHDGVLATGASGLFFVPGSRAAVTLDTGSVSDLQLSPDTDLAVYRVDNANSAADQPRRWRFIANPSADSKPQDLAIVGLERAVETPVVRAVVPWKDGLLLLGSRGCLTYDYGKTGWPVYRDCSMAKGYTNHEFNIRIDNFQWLSQEDGAILAQGDDTVLAMTADEWVVQDPNHETDIRRVTAVAGKVFAVGSGGDLIRFGAKGEPIARFGGTTTTVTNAERWRGDIDGELHSWRLLISQHNRLAKYGSVTGHWSETLLDGEPTQAALVGPKVALVSADGRVEVREQATADGPYSRVSARFGNGSLTLAPDRVSAIGSALDGTVLVAGNHAQVFRYAFGSSTWTALPRPAQDAGQVVQLADFADGLWVRTASDVVLRFDENAWQQVPDVTRWAVDEQGRRWTLDAAGVTVTQATGLGPGERFGTDAGLRRATSAARYLWQPDSSRIVLIGEEGIGVYEQRGERWQTITGHLPPASGFLPLANGLMIFTKSGPWWLSSSLDLKPLSLDPLDDSTVVRSEIPKPVSSHAYRCQLEFVSDIQGSAVEPETGGNSGRSHVTRPSDRIDLSLSAVLHPDGIKENAAGIRGFGHFGLDRVLTAPTDEPWWNSTSLALGVGPLDPQVGSLAIVAELTRPDLVTVCSFEFAADVRDLLMRPETGRGSAWSPVTTPRGRMGGLLTGRPSPAQTAVKSIGTLGYGSLVLDWVLTPGAGVQLHWRGRPDLPVWCTDHERLAIQCVRDLAFDANRGLLAMQTEFAVVWRVPTDFALRDIQVDPAASLDALRRQAPVINGPWTWALNDDGLVVMDGTTKLSWSQSPAGWRLNADWVRELAAKGDNGLLLQSDEGTWHWTTAADRSTRVKSIGFAPEAKRIETPVVTLSAERGNLSLRAFDGGAVFENGRFFFDHHDDVRGCGGSLYTLVRNRAVLRRTPDALWDIAGAWALPPDLRERQALAVAGTCIAVGAERGADALAADTGDWHHVDLPRPRPGDPPRRPYPVLPERLESGPIRWQDDGDGNFVPVLLRSGQRRPLRWWTHDRFAWDRPSCVGAMDGSRLALATDVGIVVRDAAGRFQEILPAAAFSVCAIARQGPKIIGTLFDGHSLLPTDVGSRLEVTETRENLQPVAAVIFAAAPGGPPAMDPTFREQWLTASNRQPPLTSNVAELPTANLFCNRRFLFDQPAFAGWHEPSGMIAVATCAQPRVRLGMLYAPDRNGVRLRRLFVTPANITAFGSSSGGDTFAVDADRRGYVFDPALVKLRPVENIGDAFDAGQRVALKLPDLTWRYDRRQQWDSTPHLSVEPASYPLFARHDGGVVFAFDHLTAMATDPKHDVLLLGTLGGLFSCGSRREQLPLLSLKAQCRFDIASEEPESPPVPMRVERLRFDQQGNFWVRTRHGDRCVAEACGANSRVSPFSGIHVAGTTVQFIEDAISIADTRLERSNNAWPSSRQAFRRVIDACWDDSARTLWVADRKVGLFSVRLKKIMMNNKSFWRRSSFH